MSDIKRTRTTASGSSERPAFATELDPPRTVSNATFAQRRRCQLGVWASARTDISRRKPAFIPSTPHYSRQVFLLDGDRLVEVDLRTRGVRTLHESPGMTSVAIIQEPILPPGHDETEHKGSKTNQVCTQKSRLIPEIAVRSQDLVVVINPATGNKREFTLPKDPRAILTAYLIPGDKLVGRTSNDNCRRRPPRRNRRAWLTSDGRVNSRETPHNRARVILSGKR